MENIASLCKERGATNFRSVTEDTSSSLLAVRDIHSGTGFGQVANEKQNLLNPKQPNGVNKCTEDEYKDSSCTTYYTLYIKAIATGCLGAKLVGS